MISLLRRYQALITLVLLVSVSTQMLDLGLCCTPVVWTDSDQSASSPGLTPFHQADIVSAADVLLADVEQAEDATAVDDLSNAIPPRTDDSAATVDCLCHLTFTPVGAALGVSEVVHSSLFSVLMLGRLRAPYLARPGPVPIA
jgi:hypothetical protein